MREIFEEDEEKKGHPSLTQQSTRNNVQEGDEQMYHPSLPQQQANRKNVQVGDEQVYHPSFPQQQATRGGSLVTNTTQARLSVSGKISANT